MARPRGRNYEKNLVKRKRKMVVRTSPSSPYCLTCYKELSENPIPVSKGIRYVCGDCAELMAKRGYIQIADFRRLYKDGSVRVIHFEIRDIVTGRIER